MLIDLQPGRSFIEQVCQPGYIDGFSTPDNPKTPGTVDFCLLRDPVVAPWMDAEATPSP